jgi:hypothetical protein
MLGHLSAGKHTRGEEALYPPSTLLKLQTGLRGYYNNLCASRWQGEEKIFSNQFFALSLCTKSAWPVGDDDTLTNHAAGYSHLLTRLATLVLQRQSTILWLYVEFIHDMLQPWQ